MTIVQIVSEGSLEVMRNKKGVGCITAHALGLSYRSVYRNKTYSSML